MTRLNSTYGRYFGIIFPAFWFAFLGFFIYATVTAGAVKKDPMMLFVPLAMAAFGFFMFKHMFWHLLDEVYDCGDALFIKHRGREERIPLAHIMNVSGSSFSNPPRVTLKLAIPSIFGDELTFWPVQQFSLNPFAKNKVIDQLIVRVDEARSRRAI